MSQKIDIHRLSKEEVIQLACFKVYCDEMDDNIANIFEEKANGNPFFVDEIVQESSLFIFMNFIEPIREQSN